MQLPKAIFSSLLALLVLTSSMGFFVDHMVCGMSGEHKLAINASLESCSDTCDREAGNAVDRSCCDYDSNYFQEDLPADPSDKQRKRVCSMFKYLPVSAVYESDRSTENGQFHLPEAPGPWPSVKRHILLETHLI